MERNKSIWHMISAPMVWALHFVAVYGWTAAVCAKHGDALPARIGIGALTLAALCLIVVFGWLAWRQWDYPDDCDYVHDAPTDEDRREFLGHAGWLLALVSGVGVIYVSLPALFIESCH